MNPTNKIELLPGSHITDACEAAVRMALDGHCPVEFDFNGISICAMPGSNPSDLVEGYEKECDRRHQEYIASPEYKERQEAAAKKERERKASLAAALVGAPERMTLLDPEGWKKACDANQDPYGAAVMTYAERWARMMEAGMANGKRIEDIAEDYSHLADEEGISGFMYGCAVRVLSSVWIHGEALRLWHNLKHQLRHEGEKANENGGVLNPACLVMGAAS